MNLNKYLFKFFCIKLFRLILNILLVILLASIFAHVAIYLSQNQTVEYILFKTLEPVLCVYVLHETRVMAQALVIISVFFILLLLHPRQ